MNKQRNKSGQFNKGHRASYKIIGERHSRYKHGMYGTLIYKKWCAMKRRCLNKRDTAYERYGGRGITICKKWLDFIGFYNDMGDSFIEGMSLERVDNNGNYCKKNCKWIPMAEQAKNKRSVILYTFQGKTMNTVEWANEIGIKPRTLRGRLRRYGWTLEKALTTPVISKKI